MNSTKKLLQSLLSATLLAFGFYKAACAFDPLSQAFTQQDLRAEGFRTAGSCTLPCVINTDGNKSGTNTSSGSGSGKRTA